MPVRTKLLASLAIVALCGCNQRVPLVDGPVSPTRPGAIPPQPEIASIRISPGAVMSNDGATGIVRLTGPAQPPGLFVAMSSSDGAASVPLTVGIPAGNNFAHFGVTTRWVGGDRTAVITASTPTSAASVNFEVWLPDARVHFWYYGDDNDPVSAGSFGRFIPPTAAFSATCNRNQVRLDVSAPGREPWSVTLKNAGSEPLRPNLYEASRIGVDDDRAPGFDIIGGGRSCEMVRAIFTIDEIDVSGHRVNALRGTFQQDCETGNGGRLWGEFRVENMPRGTSANCFP